MTNDRDRSRARSPMAAVNEQIDRLHVAFSLADSEFFCECGDVACKERVTLERAQFAALHHESRPVLAPAHADRMPIPDSTVIHELRGQVHRLEGALASRAVIEQAKGILVERHGLTILGAFVSLRQRARDERRSLQDVCTETIADAADADLGPSARPGEAWIERGSDDAR